MKFLIVDDSSVMRRIIKTCLASISYTNISEAPDGVVAWDIFQKEKFDVIITDWNMPNMNGLDLVKLIRNNR